LAIDDHEDTAGAEEARQGQSGGMNRLLLSSLLGAGALLLIALLYFAY